MNLIPQPKPITVSLYFGKKDNILLYLLYEDVSSADFNFIIKAILKHHINQALFHIHYYINLERIIELYDEIDETEDFEVKKQRNILFTPRDDFVYDWLQKISHSKRPQEIKEIVVKQLKECIELYKNPKKEENYQQQQPQVIVLPSNAVYGNIPVTAYQSIIPQSQITPMQRRTRKIDIKLDTATIEQLKILQDNPFGKLGKQH